MAETELNVKIGADSRGLSNALVAANNSSSQFSATFKTSVDNLNVSLNRLNSTLASITENTQKTADATSHLSTVTNFLLTITGISLAADIISATAHGVVSLGEATAGAASTLLRYADTQAYVIGQTNAIRVANDNFGGSLVRTVVPFVLATSTGLAGLSVAARAVPSVLVGVSAALGGLRTAIVAAAAAGAEFTVGFLMRLTPTSLLAARGIQFLTYRFLDLAGVLLRAQQRLGDYLNWASRYDDVGSRMAAKTLTMAGNLEQFSAQMRLAGNQDTTRGLQSYLAELDKIPAKVGKTREETRAFEVEARQMSASLEGAFASLPHYTAPLNDFLVGAVRLLANNTDEAKEWGTRFAEAFRNIDANGENFLRTIQNIDPHLIENFQNAQKLGDAYGMQRAVLQGILVLTDRMQQNTQRRFDEEVKIARVTMSQADAEEHAAAVLGKSLDTIKGLTAEYDKARLSLEGMAVAVGKFGETQEDHYRKAADLSQKRGGSLENEIRIHKQNAEMYKAGLEEEPNNSAFKEGLADELAKVKDLEAAYHGGNTELKERQKLADHQLSVGKDQLAAAQAEVDILQKNLDDSKELDKVRGYISTDTIKYATQLSVAKQQQLELTNATKATRIETQALNATRGSDAWVKASNAALDVRRGGKAGGAAEQAADERERASIAQAGAEYRAAREKQIAQEALADVKLEYAKMFDSVDADEKRHLITAETASRKRIDILRQEDAAVEANYERQLSIYDRDEMAHNKLLTRKKQAHDEYLKRINEEETKSLEKFDQEAITAASHLTSGLQGAISNALTGQRPWKALGDSLVSEISSAITNNLKVVLTTALTQAGIGSIINGVLSGDTLKSGLSSLFSGGVAAVGGAASGGGIFSGLGTALMGLLALDTGAWKVGSYGDVDGKGGWPALLHPGEMVVPPGPAASLRQAAANGQGLGGGTSTTVHAPVNLAIQATDPESFLRQLKRQAGKDIMQLLSDHVRSSAHLGLRGV